MCYMQSLLDEVMHTEKVDVGGKKRDTDAGSKSVIVFSPLHTV